MGIHPNKLYEMTPAEIVYLIDGYKKKQQAELEWRKWLVWHIGIMNRYAYYAKRYPAFNTFMGDKDAKVEKPEQTAQDHINIVIAMNKAFGGKVVQRGDKA